LNEYGIFLKNLGEMLKSYGKIFDDFGENMIEFAELLKKPKSEEKVKQKPVLELEEKPAQKKAEPKIEKEEASSKEKAVSATETVLNLIQRSSKGISVSAIKEKTGFDSRKVNGIVYRLKKSGKIKNVEKGVYREA